ncbi:MAG: S-methyl-5-thioribose-1-phosphate isomerase [Actinobacteria bacterium]|nr:S-methyl-5-thioribose-1-phosphate isomerase [Actinomycetota bacterium]
MSAVDAPDRTVWIDGDADGTVEVIDQRYLPFDVVVRPVRDAEDMHDVIADMVVRGAGCIGACAGYGVLLATRQVADLPTDQAGVELRRLADHLMAARPTAVNLAWAVRRQLAALEGIDDPAERIAIAHREAEAIADEDVAACAAIGEHGLALVREVHERTGRPVNVMTHCNAGWLAFVEHGSATAPMYAAHAAGIPIRVFVSETRPRGQGARLTAWELDRAGIDVSLIVDNAAGHLLQHGEVDMVIVGSDRTTRHGDVANKIGTYLKAVAARDNDVPFYAAMPSSTLDFSIGDGLAGVPIEERGADEVTLVSGRPSDGGEETAVRICPEGVGATNPGFDVTPARLVTGIITERGICEASEAALTALHPELASGGDR